MISKRQIPVQTPRCLHCGKTGVVTVWSDQLAAFEAGTHAQDAFPDLPADQREMLVTGTHPKCWTEMMGPEEGDEETG